MADNVTTQSATPATLAANINIASVEATFSGDLVQAGVTVLASSAGAEGARVLTLINPATQEKQDTGNTLLASIDSKLPALGQALAAASVPVVLTAAQLSTLTPPAAITGFATETTLGTRLSESDFDTKIGATNESAPGTDTAASGLNGRLQRIAQRLTSLITALGSPFQAGGSIGNTSFGAVLAPTTSGGCSSTHLVSAASTNATSVKASAGQLYGLTAFNVANYPVYIKLHNTAGTPTAGSGVVRTFAVQAGVPFTYSNPNGLAFSTGIALTIVKDLADAGSTAVAAGDCVVDIDWK